MTDLRHGWFKAEEPKETCPAADELWLFTRSELAAERRDSVRDHLIRCVWCSEKTARMADGEPVAGRPVTPN